jgi:FAD:protein FMN transferase
MGFFESDRLDGRQVRNALTAALGTIGFLWLVGAPNLIPPAQVGTILAPAPPTNSSPEIVPQASLKALRPAVVEPVLDTAHFFRFARENVLGTSFDLTVIADDRRLAEKVEARILREIEKRERMVSTYRPESEISRINSRPFVAGEQIEISYSLWLLLEECLFISKRTGGAFNAYAGAATEIWRGVEKSGVPPSNETLKSVALKSGFAYRISGRKEGEWLQRLKPGRFDLDAIGKGYILDKCVREAVSDFPYIRGLRLDIGGEIKVWGQADYARNRPWITGVADPGNPADNAPPLTRLELRHLAIATSGNYARSLNVAGRRVNHILDPRTARPVEHVVSATVIAASAQRADGLATALCVMQPAAGIAMIDALPNAACLIVDNASSQHRSRSFASLEVTATTDPSPSWPPNHFVNIRFKLVRSESRAPFHRHYVGAWIENRHGRRVRLLALWAKTADIRYVRDLDEFWRDAWVLAGEGDDTRRLLGISRATRPTGEYVLTWDGLDDQGRPVLQGEYTIHLDVNREKGPPDRRERHTLAELKLLCADQPIEITAPDQPELQNVRASYGPVGVAHE